MDNIFHFLSIVYTWTDSATSGAFEQHGLWIILAFTARCQGFRKVVDILTKKVEQWKHKLTAIE